MSPSSLDYFLDQLMNISPHLLIDAVILSVALTITFTLRAKGNTAIEEKDSKWFQKKEEQEFEKPKLFRIKLKKYNTLIIK